MISEFPAFSKLRVEHKAAVEHFTDKYAPYSDFNFISLFAWDVDSSSEIATLNGNLVIKLPDYITGETTISILGQHKIDESLHALLGYDKRVSLVPEVVVQHIKHPEQFHITEDRDQFDYVYSLPQHSSLAGNQFKGKRKKSNKFAKEYDGHIQVRPINFHDQATATRLRKVFDDWGKAGQKTEDDLKMEGKAIDRLLNHATRFDIEGLELFVGDTPVGFSIIEKLPQEHSIYHFEKALVAYPGCDQYLTQATSRLLHNQGCQLINWEQDLGIDGLRRQKMSYRPVQMLKKFVITLP